MNNTTNSPNDAPVGSHDWDIPDDFGRWHGGSLVLLLSASAMYWASIWLASGFPPLAGVATRMRARAERR